MKMLSAIIRPEGLNLLKEALHEEGINGMTISEVRGFGRQLGKKEIFRGVEYLVEFIPKLRIEILLKDDDVEKTVDILLKNLKTGEIGDGKIFIYPVEDVIRISSSERGEKAI
ncbi:P-II family nitrogen regulator [Ilyobacter polytropus]|uniref:Nitrogen regulatory protein P-II n=1 Tax=Ilyobacter polytropus (strain ATCC 51220 / DSM 2926 / LMG 16218 / CuHBu1) TaxID=572544 RepID=E3H8A7_ILYPC|nr:P-II family nitrogen regulator [Ilyobacter polytropus]ADO82674.1 nitrogen regulatory protein P-II [Ilyobacter polytropus DSM 2926]